MRIIQGQVLEGTASSSEHTLNLILVTDTRLTRYSHGSG